MKLIGLMPVRNEAWVLGLSLRAALMWCDEVVVTLHECGDASEDIARDIQRESGDRVSIEWVPGSWREMQHRQDMLNRARIFNATHIAIVDADEILTGNMLGEFRLSSGIVSNRAHNICRAMNPGHILHLPGYNLRGNICRYHASGIWGNRWFSTAFADDPRLSWTGDRFHHREPMGMDLKPYRPIQQHQGGLMHLWGASERRLRAKSALYKITERLRWPEKPVAQIDEMYSWAIHGRTGDTPAQWQFRDVPSEWWRPYSHLLEHLDLEAEPWQEEEVHRLVDANPEAARGLDLFGLA